MAISSEAWAIVAATAFGPIVAVGVSLWREAVNAKTYRRLHVFRTLMATRKLAISNDHVNAINLVEVDFYGCPKVQTAWTTYWEHLYDQTQGDIPNQAWHDKRDKLLARLLFEMGKVLKYDIPAIEIFQGGYAPKGWAFRDSQATGAIAFLNDMAGGKKALPVTLFEPGRPSVRQNDSARTGSKVAGQIDEPAETVTGAGAALRNFPALPDPLPPQSP